MPETTATEQVVQLPLEQLRPNRWNRTVFDEGALKELAESVRLEGVREPLLVRPGSQEGTYEISSGERRFRAARACGLATVPCIIRPLTDQQVAGENLTANIQREDIPPLEMARMVQAYMDDFKVTQVQAAEMFSKAQSWVSGLLNFLKLPEQVRQNISALIIGWHSLLALSKCPEDVMIRVSQEIKRGELKPEDVIKRCRQLTSSKNPAHNPKHARRGTGPIDPLAQVWQALQLDTLLLPSIWKTSFNNKGWHLSIQADTFPNQQALGEWFVQMGEALQRSDGDVDAAANRLKDEVPSLLKQQEQLAELWKVEPPDEKAARWAKGETTGDELQELEKIAVEGGPAAVYRRICGVNSPLAAAVETITWQEGGVTPAEGVQKILKALEALPNRQNG